MRSVGHRSRRRLTVWPAHAGEPDGGARRRVRRGHRRVRLGASSPNAMSRATCQSTGRAHRSNTRSDARSSSRGPAFAGTRDGARGDPRRPPRGRRILHRDELGLHRDFVEPSNSDSPNPRGGAAPSSGIRPRGRWWLAVCQEVGRSPRTPHSSRPSRPAGPQRISDRPRANILKGFSSPSNQGAKRASQANTWGAEQDE